jgi:hypothetical protein
MIATLAFKQTDRVLSCSGPFANFAHSLFLSKRTRLVQPSRGTIRDRLVMAGNQPDD